MTGQEAVQIIDGLGISRAAFARSAGLHPNTISNWAKGGKISGPSIALLRLLRSRPELIAVLGERRDS